ncbi:Methyltransferase domain-containing protein [Actinopolymorpha cephalotaxi]|uniref:Methyltransferase domain-containing protein n=1 Tax=Actinopolymorpha cephalotaxi TaxID=504797 RepID=A0A1I2ZLK1_9ACTN|nr:methyltransferase domain-containing protein [Actinopolymorpha cephalotaxi]NYH82064.1 ubiquinone/menaquinone biosynthesis C-methylase UbiE [Actinopolymorpha cephalotaxi]SFH38604.1 Methyltransferase domain-containing protein [Actinopolymorpha cephalotaxi]
MNNLLIRIVDPAFGHPRGLLGRLGGRLMARGNAEQERWAVGTGELKPGEQVLVVGHGPGVGLALAAHAVGPTGHVVGVDPSETMRRMAAERCAAEIRNGTVELRSGTAEVTGAEAASLDVAISVNNVMLWRLPDGFAELARVLRPGGRLVLTVHRHVLGRPPEELRRAAEEAGFEDVVLNLRPRRRNSPAVELTGRKAPDAA